MIVTPFATECLAHARAAWDAAHAHPFVTELANGTLSAERFRFYQMQDARYLEAFADGCAVVASRVVSPDDKIWWLDAAKMALVVEKGLHEGYGRTMGYTAADIAALELTPNNRAYGDHMVINAHRGSLVEAIAALVPCPWLYVDLGVHLLKGFGGSIPAEHPYKEWLAMYSDPGFDEYMTKLLGYLQHAADAAGPAERARAKEMFLASVRYEWMFWEQAWEFQRWPV
jgi:thiaminase (transcriptional activator TenA)